MSVFLCSNWDHKSLAANTRNLLTLQTCRFSALLCSPSHKSFWRSFQKGFGQTRMSVCVCLVLPDLNFPANVQNPDIDYECFVLLCWLVQTQIFTVHVRSFLLFSARHKGHKVFPLMYEKLFLHWLIFTLLCFALLASKSIF